MNLSKKFCLGLLVLFLACVPSFSLEITESELGKLESTLRQADESLERSQNEITTLKISLSEQTQELKRLEQELMNASDCLKKSESERKTRIIRTAIRAGLAGFVIGCVGGYAYAVNSARD